MALGQEPQHQPHVESRRLTVSVENQRDSVLDNGLLIEIGSTGQRVTLRLMDDGEPPDVRADDSRHSGMVSVDGVGFSSVLMDGDGAVIWTNDNLYIPSEFEQPSLRIVVTDSEVSGRIVNDTRMESVAESAGNIVGEGEQESGANLQVLFGAVGFALGSILSIVISYRRREPITTERSLEVVNLEPNQVRGTVIGDLVNEISEKGPLLLITVDTELKETLSGTVGVVTLECESPSIKDISQFVLDTLMSQGRAITVIDGAKSLSPLSEPAAEAALHHELARCVPGVVYFFS